jgi:lysophospholipase L1-like esterase
MLFMNTRVCSLTAALSAAGAMLATNALAVVTVLPIGDSLTNGVGSTDMGGYRIHAKSLLGDQIDFLGRRNDGPFLDNQNEGWGGFTILKIRDEVIYTVPQHSGFGDVILLTAGTNDFAWLQDPTTDGAQARANQAIHDMRSLLFTTFAVAGSRTVLISTIPRLAPNLDGYTFPEVDLYNAGLTAVVNEFVGYNQDVRLVNTTADLDYSTDMADGIHPNDAGYAKIGAAWASALNSIVVPEPTAIAAIGMLTTLSMRRVRRNRS